MWFNRRKMVCQNIVWAEQLVKPGIPPTILDVKFDTIYKEKLREKRAGYSALETPLDSDTCSSP